MVLIIKTNNRYKGFGFYCSNLKYVNGALLLVSKTRHGICPSGLSGQVQKE